MGHLHMDHQVVLHMGHQVAHLMGYQEVLLMGHQVVLPMDHQVVIQLVHQLDHLQVDLQVVLLPDHKVGLQVVHPELQQDLVFLQDTLITIKGVTLLRVILLDPIRDMAIISTQDTQTHLHLMLRVLLVVHLPKVILKDIHLIKVIPLHMDNMVLHHLAVIIRHHRHSIIKDTLQPVSLGTDSTAHHPRVKWDHHILEDRVAHHILEDHRVARLILGQEAHIQLAIRAMIKLEVDILVTLVVQDLDLHRRKEQVQRHQRPLVPPLLPQYPHRQQLNKFFKCYLDLFFFSSFKLLLVFYHT